MYLNFPLVVVTGNKEKFDIFKGVFDQYGLEITRQELETPEIQAVDVKDVAEYSARYAAEKLGKTVLKTDSGNYIEALGGFPGVYAKYLSDWFTTEDLLNLMKGKVSRRVEFRETIALCAPCENPVSFTGRSYGEITKKAKGEGRIFDQIVIREGMNKNQALYTYQEMQEFFQKKLDHYHEAARWIKENI